MKRAGRWASGIGVLVSVGLLSVTQGYAGDDDGRGCSNASLRGRYGLATHGDFVGVYGTGDAARYPLLHRAFRRSGSGKGR